MTDIVKQSDLKPASFQYDYKLTNGQKKLLSLLHEKINSSQVIERDDIVQLYIDAMCRNSQKMKWNYELQRKIPKEVTKDTWWIRTEALSWFKSNLGACIIKGKLLVIPIIDI